MVAVLLLCATSAAGGRPAHPAPPRVSCIFESPTSKLMQSSAPLDPSVLEAYSVLRRPASPADLPPPINTLGPEFELQLRSYNPMFTRLLSGTSPKRDFFLVPGFLRALTIAPARCLPPRLRRQRAAMVLRARRRARQPAFRIGEGSTRAQQYGFDSCHLFSEVASYAQFVSDGSPGTGTAIVPDGVARVRFVMPNVPPRVVQVRDNFLTYGGGASQQRGLRRLDEIARRILSPRLSPAERRRRERMGREQSTKILRRLTPVRVDWLGPDGQVMRNFTPPHGPGAQFQFVAING